MNDTDRASGASSSLSPPLSTLVLRVFSPATVTCQCHLGLGYVDLYFDVLAVFNQSFFIIIVLKCTYGV